jgi:hypothetical protein
MFLFEAAKHAVDVWVFQQRREQLPHLGGHMLEVVIHGDHHIARGVRQAAQRSLGLALVVHQVKPLYLRVCAGKGRYDLPGVVGGAVVDKDDLVLAALRAQCVRNGSREIPKPAPGPVDGNHHRYPSEGVPLLAGRWSGRRVGAERP